MTARLSFLAAALALTAAAPDAAPPLRLIPAASLRGEQTVGPAAILSRAAIGRPDAAVIGADVPLAAYGARRGFARGDILHAGGATGIDGVPGAIFCEDRHRDAAARYCLFDAKDGGRFDHALRTGANGPGRTWAIAPVPYQLIEGQPLAADGVVRLRYVGPLDLPHTLAFDVEAFANGRLRDVPHARHFVSIEKLPAYGLIGSAVVTILAYDFKTRIATIRMDHDLAPGHIDLPELSRGY